MSRARARATTIGVLPAVLAIGLAGCGPFESDYVWSEDFEEPGCAGVPCGWERLAGTDSGARWAETLPGEHGLVLEGSGVIVSRQIDLTFAFSTFDSNIALDLIARCDVGSGLEVEIGASEQTTGTVHGYAPASLNVLTSWTDPRPNAVRIGSDGVNLSSIDTITFTKSGDGVCEIDFVGLIDDTFRFGR